MIEKTMNEHNRTAFYPQLHPLIDLQARLETIQ